LDLKQIYIVQNKVINLVNNVLMFNRHLISSSKMLTLQKK
jgi:hypothetical protein